MCQTTHKSRNVNFDDTHSWPQMDVIFSVLDGIRTRNVHKVRRLFTVNYIGKTLAVALVGISLRRRTVICSIKPTGIFRPMY